MIRKAILNKENNCVGIGKRGISILLAVLLLAGTFAVIPFVSNADDAQKNAFSILAEASTETKPTEKIWKYNVHEFAVKPDYTVSDKNYSSPVVGFSELNQAVVSWNSYDGADGYTLNIYDSANTLILSKDTEDVTYNIPNGTFTQGKEYQLQVVAKCANEVLAGSMIRPYKYSEPVSFNDIAVNLNGKNMRTDAPANDEIYTRAPIEAGTLAIKNFVLQDSFYYTNTSKLPSNTQAIAYWVGQTESSDGSYYSLNFRHDRMPATMLSGGVCYYVPTNGDPVHTGGFQSNLYQSYTDNKHGLFKEGWIVIPLSNYGDSGKQTILSADSINLLLPWAQYKTKIAADGTKLENGNLSDTDRNIYCSNIFAISDVDSFLKLYLTEDADNSYAAITDTDFKPKKYNEYGEFYNDAVPENKYEINVSGGQNVKFTMTDSVTGTRGMQITFTAPKDGYYDLTHKFDVVNNLSAKGKVYYRVVKESDNSVVYPKDNNYLELAIDGNNPKASLQPVDVCLKKGEKVIIEAFAELTSGNSVTVDLGYTTMTYVDSAESSKGFVKTYNAVEYYNSRRMSTNMPVFSYMTADRIEYKMADFSSDIENPTVINAKTYNVGWSDNLYYVKSGKILGYYDVKTTAVKMKSADKLGAYVSYNATESGTLSLTMPIRTESKTYNVRVVKNGAQVWPESGYATVSETTVMAETYVNSGDVVAIQIYSAEEEQIAGYISPEFVLTQTDNFNEINGISYSPLWERPYSHKPDYNGEYKAHPSSLFAFKIKEHNSDESKAVAKAVNAFDASKGNYLYYSEYASGFSFKKDNLLFTANNKISGAVIDFIAPFAGKYDISMPIKVLSGKGTVLYNVYVNEEQIHPKDVLTSNSLNVGGMVNNPALQLELSVGDVVTVEVLAKPKGESMQLDLGTPLFHRFNNTVNNGSEAMDVYTPYLFTGFEKNGINERLAANARFEFILKNKNGKKEQCTVYNYSNKTITDKNGSGFKFTDNGTVTVDVNNTALTHILKFTSPKDISGSVQFSVSSVSAADVHLLKDGKQIWPESGYYKATTEPENVYLDVELAKDTVIEWEIRAENATVVSLAVPNITDYYHVNSYTNEDTSYSALSGNPFDDEFTGDYKRYNNELWLYDLTEVKDGTVKNIVPDKYDSAIGNYLYSSKTNTGYRFGERLTAELKDGEKTYGISLGFISPRADSFTLRTGLEIITENTEATLNVRIVHNGKTVWNGDKKTEWYTIKTKNGDAVQIPLKLLDLEKDDKVEIQVFATDITVNGKAADQIEVTLVNPDFYSESIVIQDSVNIKAAVLYPHEQFQYYKKAYSGRYTHMENRFNYEFMTYGEEITYFTPDYYDGTKLYNSAVSGSPQYNLAANTITLTPTVREQKGISLRYTPAMDAEAILMAIPTVTSIDENTVVKFRIMHNDTRLWPKEGLDQNVLSEWETLDKENPTSLIDDRISAEMLSNDNIYIELYAETDSDTAEPVTVSLDVFAATVYRKTTDKIGYSFQNENTQIVQLDPFWSYEYSESSKNVEWHRLSNSTKDGYYSIPGVTYNGINYKTGLYGFTKHGILLNKTEAPVYSITFTAPLNGFYKMGNEKMANYGEYTANFKYRITVNDKAVWPSSGWNVYQGTADSSDTSYKGLSFELRAGDKLRFEVTTEKAYEEIEVNSRYRAKWLINLTYSQWENMYNTSSDIFNMLTFDMVDYFKNLAEKQAENQFDIEYDKHYAESLKPDEEDNNTDNNQNDENNSSVDNSSSDTSSDTKNDETLENDNQQENDYDNSEENYTDEEGNWVEGTEDKVIYTPGVIRKQIKKYQTIVYPVLEIVLISVASVLVIAAVVIFILHKKGKINWFKKKNDKKVKK